MNTTQNENQSQNNFEEVSKSTNRESKAVQDRIFKHSIDLHLSGKFEEIKEKYDRKRSLRNRGNLFDISKYFKISYVNILKDSMDLIVIDYHKYEENSAQRMVLEQMYLALSLSIESLEN